MPVTTLARRSLPESAQRGAVFQTQSQSAWPPISSIDLTFRECGLDERKRSLAPYRERPDDYAECDKSDQENWLSTKTNFAVNLEKSSPMMLSTRSWHCMQSSAARLSAFMLTHVFQAKSQTMIRLMPTAPVDKATWVGAEVWPSCRRSQVWREFRDDSTWSPDGPRLNDAGGD